MIIIGPPPVISLDRSRYISEHYEREVTPEGRIIWRKKTDS